MKKIFTFLFAICCIVSFSHGQYYFKAYPNAGTNPGGLNVDNEYPNGGGLTTGWTAVIGPSVTTPAWSANQTIPFGFNFNTNPVTQYKVSSTGVLTFTTSATAVPPVAKTALPSTSIPDNSVCVWGIQASGTNDYVMSKTFGSAPNRQHWVFFSSHSLNGGWSYWSIVMEETSDLIYIVDQRHSGTNGGVSMGVQINSTTASTVGSNVLPLAGTSETPADNSYYEFIQGTRPANDIVLTSLNLTNSAAVNSVNTISGTLSNDGGDTLKSYTLVWTADGGATLNSEVITTSVPSLGSANFTHQTTWTATTGAHAIEVYTTLPNGGVDANTSNDTLVQGIAVGSNGQTVSKNPLLEEFTTAPCQFCPDGAVVVENILNANPAVIGVGLHACFGSDAMTIPEASAYCAAFGSGAPTACVDRIRYAGETNVAFSRANNQWLNRANSQSMLGSSVGVTVTGSYDPNTALGNIDVTANFVDYTAGDLRVTLFVVEDHVRGVGNGYDQVNFYNTQSGHPYSGAGNPITNYDHRHVLRDVYPEDDAWGNSNPIPAAPSLNTNYTMNQTILVDPTWDADSITLVGFVSYFDGDVAQRNVLNAFEVKLSNLVTSIEEISLSSNNLSIYPNPTNSITNLEFVLGSASNVQLDLFDLTGKKLRSENFGTLAQGKQLLQMNVEDLNQGFYFVNLNVNGNIITKKISVIK